MNKKTLDLETTQFSPQNVVLSQEPLDVSEAGAFYARCFAEEYATYATPEFLDSVRGSMTLGILADNLTERKLVQARHAGRLVGTAVGIQRGQMFYVWGVYVDPRHLRAGLGRRLMLEICDGLDANVTIEVQVIASSQNALAFYKSLGFQKVNADQSEVFPGICLDIDVLACQGAFCAQ